MARVRVRLFAAFREAAGRPSVDLDLDEGATVASLRAALAREVPALAAAGGALVVALDGEFVGDGARVGRGADVAVFPPVAGG